MLNWHENWRENDNKEDSPTPVRNEKAEGKGVFDDDEEEEEEEEDKETVKRIKERLPRIQDAKTKPIHPYAAEAYTCVGDCDRINEMVKSRLRELNPMRELLGPPQDPPAERTESLPSSSDVPEAVFVGVYFKFVWEEPCTHITGDVFGQSQTAVVDAIFKRAPLNHPVDVHFAAPSTAGWPKLLVAVRCLDEHARLLPAGYGFCHLPMLPGVTTLDIHCWLPAGSMRDEVAKFFLGNTAELAIDEIICAKPSFINRSRLLTVPAGNVRVCISTFLRYFGRYNIDSPLRGYKQPKN
mmetsp:Transcript_16565/g.53944  ORF Transcript_16565/g.53944 Transcript_16565/m.53944 type:complete len:296 (-) Transcript_16565:608-1495(-)